MNPTPPQVGDEAPDFELPAHPMGSLRLSSLRGRPVVLFFYPKDNTPGCTKEACEFRDLLPSFEKLNAAIVGVSRDSLASHKRFAEKHALPFPLVSDVEETACSRYHVIRLKNMYGRQVRGIERSTFLIDQDGKVRAVWRKVKVAGHARSVLDTLRNLVEAEKEDLA